MYGVCAIPTAMLIRICRQTKAFLLTGIYLLNFRSFYVNIRSLITSRQANICSVTLEFIYHSICRHVLEHVNLKVWSHGHTHFLLYKF